MATQLQLRRGTKIQNDAFVGAEGELSYDTTTKGVRVHDGATAGGVQIATLVAVQYPTSENNYTWARKYSDGWVEQGGKTSQTTSETVVLPFEMANTNYCVQLTCVDKDPGDQNWTCSAKTTTDFVYKNTESFAANWEVKGMAA